MKALYWGISLLTLTASSQAAIVFDSVNATQGLYQTNATVATGYTPTAGTDAVLLMGVAADGGFTGSLGATFGGNAMTLLASDARVAIFGYVLSNTAAGDLRVTTGVTSTETIITYGTLTGVDTSTFGSLTTAVDATAVTTVSPRTITGNVLTGLSSGDYVLSLFNQNSMYGISSTTQSSLTNLNTFSGAAGASYTASIAGGVIASAGNFTPVWNIADGGSGFPNNATNAYFAAVAFTAAVVPEPSTYALLGGLAALGLVIVRRRRA